MCVVVLVVNACRRIAWRVMVAVVMTWVGRSEMIVGWMVVVVVI